LSRRPAVAVAGTATALLLALVGVSSGGEVAVKSPAPIAILLHAGGFILPEGPTGMERARRAAMAAGLEPIDIDYTLGDPMQAWRDVRDIARRYKASGRRIVAYGDSAGGNLAALLAQHVLGEAAVVNSPPSSLVNWPYREGIDDPLQVMGMDLWDFEKTSLKERQFLSPKLHRTRNLIVVMATPEDAVVPYSMNATWAKADPKVKLWQIKGEHMGGAGAVYDRHLANAMRFLNGRLGRHDPSPLSHAPHAGGPVHPPGVPPQRCSSTSCTWGPFGKAEAPLDALAPRCHLRSDPTACDNSTRFPSGSRT